VLALLHHFLLQKQNCLDHIAQEFYVIVVFVLIYIDHEYFPIDDNILFLVSLVGFLLYHFLRLQVLAQQVVASLQIVV
jgi:hypothetical protein